MNHSVINSIPERSKTAGKLFAFDFIRATCCLLIFTAHYRNIHAPDLFLPRAATIALSMFAFTSSYLLCGRYTKFDRNYFKKRVLKIYPTVFSALIITASYLAIFNNLKLTPDILIHMTGTSILGYYFTIPASGLGFGMWFISFVLIGYAILPTTKAIFEKTVKTGGLQVGATLTFLLTIIGLIAVLFPLHENNIYTYFNESFAWFFIGIFYKTTEEKYKFLTSQLFVFAVLLLSWAGMAYFYFFGGAILQFLSIVIIPLWAYPLFCSCAEYLKNKNHIKNTILFFSSISFEFYLIHLYLMGGSAIQINFFNLNTTGYYFYILLLCTIVSFFANKLSGLIRKTCANILGMPNGQ